jgi:hypothetical protein
MVVEAQRLRGSKAQSGEVQRKRIVTALSL